MKWILTGLMNWKTSLTAILTASFLLLESFSVITISASEKQQLIAAFIIVFGWFAKDGEKSGTPDKPKN